VLRLASRGTVRLRNGQPSGPVRLDGQHTFGTRGYRHAGMRSEIGSPYSARSSAGEAVSREILPAEESGVHDAIVEQRARGLAKPSITLSAPAR
jgi:hypothetical protein